MVERVVEILISIVERTIFLSSSNVEQPDLLFSSETCLRRNNTGMPTRWRSFSWNWRCTRWIFQETKPQKRVGSLEIPRLEPRWKRKVKYCIYSPSYQLRAITKVWNTSEISIARRNFEISRFRNRRTVKNFVVTPLRRSNKFRNLTKL